MSTATIKNMSTTTKPIIETTMGDLIDAFLEKHNIIMPGDASFKFRGCINSRNARILLHHAHGFLFSPETSESSGEPEPEAVPEPILLDEGGREGPHFDDEHYGEVT